MSNDPSVNLNKLVKENIRFEYPKGIGVVKGLQHFMIIRELEFKEPEKSKDGFNGQTITENIIGADNQLDFYELKRAFVLHLPPGSLKTQYSADYQDVNLGIFGEILSQNVNEITDNVFYSKKSKVWQQALNRIHVQKSILLFCLGKLR